MIRFRKGMEVAVVFLDHVEDSGEPLTFIVYGRIHEVQRKYLVIDSWTYVDPKDTRDDNVKSWVILRSTILNWYQLERKTMWK